MSKVYDATTEHKMIEKGKDKPKGSAKGTHPNKGIKGKNPYSGKVVS
jgi:hypothetical protein